MMTPMIDRLRRWALCPALLLAVQLAGATETRRWTIDTAEGFLEGRGQGVEVTADGTLRWVGGWSAGPDFEEPIVMAGVK